MPRTGGRGWQFALAGLLAVDVWLAVTVVTAAALARRGSDASIYWSAVVAIAVVLGGAVMLTLRVWRRLRAARQATPS